LATQLTGNSRDAKPIVIVYFAQHQLGAITARGLVPKPFTAFGSIGNRAGCCRNFLGGCFNGDTALEPVASVPVVRKARFGITPCYFTSVRHC